MSDEFATFLSVRSGNCMAQLRLKPESISPRVSCRIWAGIGLPGPLWGKGNKNKIKNALKYCWDEYSALLGVRSGTPIQLGNRTFLPDLGRVNPKN